MLDMTKKARNVRAESRYSFLCNAAVLLVLTAIAFILFPHVAKIGARNTMFWDALFMAGILCFSIVLEKYSVLVAGLCEKVIINVLSALYTFVILSFANLILFMSWPRFLMDAAVSALAVILLTLGDFLYDKGMQNPKKFRKPRLLILNSDDETLLRMKRMKYGVLSTYDAWYEELKGRTIAEVEALVETRFPEFDAICVLDGLEEEEYHLAVKKAVELQKDLFIVPDIVDAGKTNARIVRFDDVLTLYMPKHYVSNVELFAKRIVDLVAALLGIVLAAIPMAVIALLIKCTSPGPVFYKQERLTKDKRPFMIYKFRTMVPDAEKLTGPKFAEKDDPRITPIGKILRACRLDELPQILNILKGDMSLVGPRPERAVFVEAFEKEIENYDYRFAVKAGLTSLSHVYGRYSTYIHDRTYYDLFYITNYSFFLDLKIILLTTKTMFMKSAAEGEDSFKVKTVANQKNGEEVRK